MDPTNGSRISLPPISSLIDGPSNDLIENGMFDPHPLHRCILPNVDRQLPNCHLNPRMPEKLHYHHQPNRNLMRDFRWLAVLVVHLRHRRYHRLQASTFPIMLH